jgi:NAD(P)-dependent dehydrogenase (short-subunit alcohol dehydrogenase family)
LLMKFLVQTKGKIVILSSMAHRGLSENINIKDFFDPSKGASLPFFQYGYSKLFNILTSLQIHRLYHLKHGVRSNALHPGNIATEIGKDEFGFIYKFFAPVIEPTFFKTIFEGSQTTLYLASSPEVEEISGKFFQDNMAMEPSNLAKNEKLAQELWDYSELMCKKMLGNVDFEF